MPRLQLWLVVEQVHLRRSAVHEEVDDTLSARSEMESGEQLRVRDRCQGGRANANGRTAEELSPCERSEVFFRCVHG